MKSVLISIRPKWCEAIAAGEKTIEVRKTRPKIEPPFRCYIYETNSTKGVHGFSVLGRYRIGQVIGEFICDKVMFLTPLGLRGFEMREEILKLSCLTNDDLNAYGGLKTLYGWHISDLKIYDRPRELSEFGRFDGTVPMKRPCAPWCYVKER
jgi:predicted transcriptional regulator|nr:MAG TPA: hypothetical protein [Caudoviricetes sp.]